jgi:virulence-associated protein VapD
MARSKTTMPKPKLSDAVTNENDAAETEASASEQQQASEAAGDPSDSSEVEASADESAATAEPEAGSKTLADFRAAFGHEQGSVFFADQTPFEDACTAHMQTQAETIAAQQKQIDDLKQQNTELAKQVMGEADPVDTAAGETTAAGSDEVSSFAEAQRKKLQKS